MSLKLRWKYVAIPVVALILVGVVLFLIREPVLFFIGDFLVIKDKLQPVDVIHVIAGPDYRTDYAIQLYKEGYAKQIFFTGGWCSKHKVNHSEHGKERAIEQGVPSEAIAIDGTEITSTYSEAVRLKEFITENPIPIRSVIVVSDPYHMRRARWTYRKVLGDQIILQMAPVPFEQLPYPNRWWTNWESRSIVRDEYVKTVFYYARYQFSWGPLREWLATFDKY
jgi:uncharacterized SAM-binding protein YcdF (DUF218 family)